MMKDLAHPITRHLPLIIAFAAGTALVWAQRSENLIITKEIQQDLSIEEIITELKAGNERFVADKPLEFDFPKQVQLTATGQSPAAFILACVDSRVLPELLFDVAIGDVFDGRVAGNVINEDLAGSMEYACAAVGSKVIVVLGHTNCGAVKGAVDKVELGNLTGLLAKIEPAVEAVAEGKGKRSSKNKELVKAAVVKNVSLTVEAIREISPVLKGLEDKGKIAIVGAVYDVATGKVEFLDGK